MVYSWEWTVILKGGNNLNNYDRQNYSISDEVVRYKIWKFTFIVIIMYTYIMFSVTKSLFSTSIIYVYPPQL